MNNLTPYERETIFNFNDDELLAEVYTCNKTLINRLAILCSKNQAITLKSQDEYSATYNMPKSYIKIRIPKQYTDEQREKMALQARERFHGKKESEG